jgi:ABC-type antimicrobial peptide transport system permease subunit
MLEGKRGYDPIFPVFLVGYGYLADKLGVSEGDSIEVCVRDGIRSNRQNLEALAKKYGLIFFSAEKSFGILDGIVSFISIISAFICAVVIIILFVSSFNLNMMSFFERQKEIGTMYSIGAKPGWINLLLLCEMFVFSSFCSILSIAVYYALSLSFHEGFGVGPLEPAFAGSNFIFMLSLPAIAYSYAVILAVMALSAWYPIYLTYKINPVEVFNEGNI